MGLAGGKDLRGDGDNRYRSESWIFYMRKDLSFIGPGKALGLDFGPSFPVPAGQSDSRRLTGTFAFPSLASPDSLASPYYHLICISSVSYQPG